MHIAHYQIEHAGGGIGAVAYISPDQHPRDFLNNLDCAAVIDALKRAIATLEAGDGIGAVAYAGEAFARLSLYHHT